MIYLLKTFVLLLLVLLTACESNPPAPVIDRVPQSGKPKPPIAATSKPADVKAIGTKDWRPDSHQVKKGDTLFSIGLEYGIDYKEIAVANNITPPYPIKIGQKLDLTSFKTKLAAPDTNSTVVSEPDDGVVVTPIKTEPANTGTQTTTPNIKPATAPAATPNLTEPKATREPYSLEAMNRTSPIKATEPKPTDAKPTEAKSTEAKPAEAKPTDDEGINWAWPTQGKVVANFNESTNKGIDIGGATGQAVNATSAGKVIYSGSDLRGYGKLVIIKHNKTYLSVYAHNSKIIVKEGQAVAAGQKIAEMGNSDSNSVKLHFEIRRLGKSVDPAKYLNQN